MSLNLNETIGTVAGELWNLLSSSNNLTPSEINKKLKNRTSDEISLGLGWLAREGKLIVTKNGRITRYSLDG